MNCNKFDKKECVGKVWCGICPLYTYECDPNFTYTPTDLERFAMKAQQEFFKRYQDYMRDDKKEKAMSYYSCIQILERLLKEV